MNNNNTHRLDLPAIDGANPLGFLAALGTALVYSECDPSVRMGWVNGPRWTPFLATAKPLDKDRVCEALAERLCGSPVDDDAASTLKIAKKIMEAVGKDLKKANRDLKERKLPRSEAKAAREVEIVPLEVELDAVRCQYLAALKNAVPSPELALGEITDCKVRQFRSCALDACASHSLRAKSLLIGAFGVDLEQKKTGTIFPTPFCMARGGQLRFVKTVQELVDKVSPNRLYEALFKEWTFKDEGLSLRWDPRDDRQYALLDRDPTATNNKVTTVWMANLLAYRALAFYPCAPGSASPGRNLSPTAAWSQGSNTACFTWPLWTDPLAPPTIGALITHRAFASADIQSFRRELFARGVTATYRCRRVKSGDYLNFSPPIALGYASHYGLGLFKAVEERPNVAPTSAGADLRDGQGNRCGHV